MARLLALCSLPRTNPGNRLQYIRRNGPYTLVHELPRVAQRSCPSVHLPRLLLAWVTTEAVRTQSRELVLEVIHCPSSCGSSDIYSSRRRGHTSGSAIRWNGLFKAAVSCWTYDGPGRDKRVRGVDW